VAVASGPEQAPAGDAGSPEGPCEVTIVAHDIGPVGGMERVLSELILGLRRSGDRVTVIARTCELPEGSGVNFHRVRGPGRPFLLAYPWFLLAASLTVARRARGVLQVTGGLVLNRADVVSVHYCHQVGPANPSRAGALYRANIRLVRIAKRLSERAVFRRNREAVFACVSEGVADEVREHYPALAPNVIAIHNGVDLERFEPGRWSEQARAERERLGVGERELVALFVGGEWERKGLRPAIEALPGAPGWTLAVAGDGDRSHFEALARSLGVDERIRWLGVQREVAPLYAMADAFLLPTSYETFSLATFEAAASGLPLLVTPVNGVRELLEPGVNGFFIDRRPEGISEALRQLSDDPGRRLEMGRAARRSSLRFSWDNTVELHRRLYRRLAGASRATRAP
jgi:UDP-glucose:(heptosyl)LPS alpha-1,3-glucosyltransferase